MSIIVQTRVELWKQIWSWPVVGGVLFLLLSSGVTFSTTDHPLLADLFYSVSAVLFVVKFLTWEDARQLDRPKRNRSYGLAIGLTLLILCATIWGNHRLSASRQARPGVTQSPSVEHPPEKKPEDSPKAGAIGAQTTTSPEKQVPDKQPKLTGQEGKALARHQGKVAGNIQPNVASPPAIQINNAPNGIAISGGNVSNPTVNNYLPPQRGLTTDQRDKLVACLRQSGTFSLLVRHAEHNFEAQTYADSLASALRDGGWAVPDDAMATFMTETRQGRGLQILVNDINHAPPGAAALQNCLKQVGFEAVGMPMPQIIGPKDFVLYIGVQ
jgi:hypothetical protein